MEKQAEDAYGVYWRPHQEQLEAEEEAILTANDVEDRTFLSLVHDIEAANVMSMFLYMIIVLINMFIAASHEQGVDGTRRQFSMLKKHAPIRFRLYLMYFDRFKSSNFSLIGQYNEPLKLQALTIFKLLFDVTNVDVSSPDGCWVASDGAKKLNRRPCVDLLDILYFYMPF